MMSRTTVYHWDGQNLVRESNGEGGVKATYLRGAGLIAQVIDLSLFYYLLNAHGDVVQRVDAKRQAAPRYEYDAFGVQREKAGYNPDKDPNPLRYCGEYFDSDVQEYYLRARTYQPGNGRFTSEDPARSGHNWYAYCNGEPVMHGDPSGLWTSAFWEEQLIDSKIKEAEKKRKPSGTQSVPTWGYGEPGGYISPPSASGGGGMQGRPGQYSNEPPTSTNPRSSANPESYFYNPNRDQLKHSVGTVLGGAGTSNQRQSGQYSYQEWSPAEGWTIFGRALYYDDFRAPSFDISEGEFILSDMGGGLFEAGVKMPSFEMFGVEVEAVFHLNVGDGELRAGISPEFAGLGAQASLISGTLELTFEDYFVVELEGYFLGIGAEAGAGSDGYTFKLISPLGGGGANIGFK